MKYVPSFMAGNWMIFVWILEKFWTSCPPLVVPTAAGGQKYFQSYCDRIQLLFECSDDESGTDLFKPELGVGMYSGDVSTLNWIVFDGQGILDLNLVPGVPYFLSFRYHNNAGLTTLETPGVLICDSSPPHIVLVSDGCF